MKINYLRIGTSYFKKINRPNMDGTTTATLQPWKKDTIIEDHDGYFGVMVPPVSVKPCHFERYCNYIKN